jgi:hypothetical protein
MTEHVWSAIRTQAIHSFKGELPNAATEAAILEVFQLMPTTVIRTLNEVAEHYAQGKARSGWAVTKARLTGAANPTRDITVQGHDREHAITQAKTWIHNAGLYISQQDELEDALFVSNFGDRGPTLRPWAKDETLRATMLTLWTEQRVRAEKAEADHIAWTEKCHDDLERAGRHTPTTAKADDDIPF